VDLLHGDLEAVKAELGDVSASVAPGHEDLARVEAGLAPLPDSLDTLASKFDELPGHLDHLRVQLAQQIDALHTDLSGLPFVKKS